MGEGVEDAHRPGWVRKIIMMVGGRGATAVVASGKRPHLVILL